MHYIIDPNILLGLLYIAKMFHIHIMLSLIEKKTVFYRVQYGSMPIFGLKCHAFNWHSIQTLIQEITCYEHQYEDNL